MGTMPVAGLLQEVFAGPAQVCNGFLKGIAILCHISLLGICRPQALPASILTFCLNLLRSILRMLCDITTGIPEGHCLGLFFHAGRWRPVA